MPSLPSNIIATEFDSFNDTYEKNFQVALRKDPTNTKEQAFQVKMKNTGGVIKAYPNQNINISNPNYSNFLIFDQPMSFDTWYSVNFDKDEDLYLCLEISLNGGQNNIPYTITKANFKLYDKTLTSKYTTVERQTALSDYTTGLIATRIIKLIAVLPFLGRLNVIQVHREENIYIKLDSIFNIPYIRL